MSMSTHVVLLRSPKNETYQKNLKVFNACRDANISLPKEIEEYFPDEDPESPLEIKYKPREWANEYAQGYEIDIDSLPEGVKTIRFYNSW